MSFGDFLLTYILRSLNIFALVVIIIIINFSSCDLTLIKFADDMPLVAQLRDDDSLESYFLQVKKLDGINVFKPQELVFDRK